MPELPEVETIKNDLQCYLVGKKIQSVEVRLAKLVQPGALEFQKRLAGQTIKSITRRAKMLVFELSDNYMLIHLKMSGQLIYQTGQNIYSHVVFTFTDGSHLYFNDQRQFGWLRLVSQNELDKEVSKYGPEPLSREFTLSKFSELLGQNERSKIKQFLMKQDKIAGIGNIYADEACFAAKIQPTRIIKTLTPDERQKLYQSIKAVLKSAIAKRGTSADKYVDAKGERGSYSNYLKVYGREGQKCKVCGTLITKIRFAGRGTHYCAGCQR